ncbi:hypothetical protein LUZ63_011321 [Rhynchospora breviuscula]|uniref:C2H2-type domain-containing protein n=1 Tax=Rhynchospora breviuscula TaxID=2022672 RepID=A0A9Q0CIV1_9POAL|nr:hypothetical protein LUZ63_011321 [Rhynchospora breviuscula]
MSFPIEKSNDGRKTWQKRKRTQRLSNINSISQPPLAPVVTSPASSSADFSAITTEEEEIDLANSLILLSRGGNMKDQATAMQSDTPTSPPPSIKVEKVEKTERNDKSTSRRLVEPAAQLNSNEYVCKTCDKRFSSFQALGGHRASHKKPKTTSEDQKVQSPSDTGTTSVTLKLDDISNYKDEIQVNSPVEKPPPVLTIGSKVRVHQCGICQAEFNTGQALGGHMRRHKPLNGGVDQSRNKKDRSGLDLDLNFPPSDQGEVVHPPPPIFDQGEVMHELPPPIYPYDGNPPTQLMLGSPALTNCLL